MASENAAGRSPEALAAVRHLVELGYEDPLDAAARQMAEERARQAELHRTEELLRGGQVAAAIELLERAAHDAPEWLAVRHWLARAYFRAGRLAETAELLEWLQFHGVEHVELTLMRATIALRRRRFAEACDEAEYAKGLQTPLSAADVLLGEVNFRRGNYPAANAAYRRALEQTPRNAAAKIGLAAVALSTGSHEEAADWALQAIEEGTPQWQAHCHLGRALLGLGRLAEARVALENCTRIHPTAAAPYRWLIRIGEQTGDESAAAEARRRAREVVARRRAPLPRRG